MGAGPVQPEEFISLIVSPEGLFEEKMKAQGHAKPKPHAARLKAVTATRRELHASPYTVYQNRNLTLVKPISQIYALRDNQVILNADAARQFTKSEQLFPADFAMDQLVIHESVLSAETVLKTYQTYRNTSPPALVEHLKSLTVGVWNIWHGGIHWTTEEDGWDSRLRIVEMIRENHVDVILMQETYSSGDFIAAELGWYLATTSDWDYCFQGANISVLSRYPIKGLYVNKETEFNNVAVKLAISETQAVYAMSNWYGMQSFPLVADYHQSRFDDADTVPILFGGDFNAVPHTDGGRSPASMGLLEAGFTDAFRRLHPDVEDNPGYTHKSGRRIDQLYYKGKGLSNLSTQVISSWPTGFPSDHFLIVAQFELND